MNVTNGDLSMVYLSAAFPVSFSAVSTCAANADVISVICAANVDVISVFQHLFYIFEFLSFQKIDIISA